MPATSRKRSRRSTKLSTEKKQKVSSGFYEQLIALMVGGELTKTGWGDVDLRSLHLRVEVKSGDNNRALRVRSKQKGCAQNILALSKKKQAAYAFVTYRNKTRLDGKMKSQTARIKSEIGLLNFLTGRTDTVYILGLEAVDSLENLIGTRCDGHKGRHGEKHMHVLRSHLEMFSGRPNTIIATLGLNHGPWALKRERVQMPAPHDRSIIMEFELVTLLPQRLSSKLWKEIRLRLYDPVVDNLF